MRRASARRADRISRTPAEILEDRAGFEHRDRLAVRPLGSTIAGMRLLGAIVRNSGSNCSPLPIFTSFTSSGTPVLQHDGDLPAVRRRPVVELDRLGLRGHRRSPRSAIRTSASRRKTQARRSLTAFNKFERHMNGHLRGRSGTCWHSPGHRRSAIPKETDMLARRFTIVCLLVTLFGMALRHPRRGCGRNRQYYQTASASSCFGKPKIFCQSPLNQTRTPQKPESDLTKNNRRLQRNLSPVPPAAAAGDGGDAGRFGAAFSRLPACVPPTRRRSKHPR